MLMRQSLSLILTFLAAPSLQAQAPVPEDVKFVDEEKGVPATSIMNLPREVTLIKAKSLMADNGIKFRDIQQMNGLRIYGIPMEKGEEITISMKVEDADANEMRCRVMLPVQNNRMTPGLTRVNEYMVPALRMKKMVIKNVMDGPFLLAYVVYGGVNRPYEVRIKRNPAPVAK